MEVNGAALSQTSSAHHLDFMSLEHELSALKTKALSQISPETAQVLQDAINTLAKSGLSEQAVRTGDQAPDFELPDASGQNVRLSNLLKTGPVVLVFYRGQWCPYCNLTLRMYQASLLAIRELGGQLVAVSSQKPDGSLSVQEMNSLTFPVLSDSENKAATAFGLLFQLPESLIQVFKARKIDLPSINGSGSWELPVPAIYVISKEGKVVADHVDADHRNRLGPEKVILALKALETS